MVHSDRGVLRTIESREIEHDNGHVTVHSDPPPRCHRHSKPATPLGGVRRRAGPHSGTEEEEEEKEETFKFGGNQVWRP